MVDRDLKLNSLSRYSKQSPKYVLEEHGHCEVPAGCGGVVLRWRNPHREVPIELWMVRRGSIQVYLDGAPLKSARPLVTIHEKHVLAFSASGLKANAGFLMFVAVCNEDVRILSAGDGSWKYTVTPPTDDSWMSPGFDDSDWGSMIPLPLAEIGDKNRDPYGEQKLRDMGAHSIGLREAVDRAWIRRAITLEQA